MSALDDYPWLLAAWQPLARAMAEDRLAHAWLLSGPSGLGKRVFAHAWLAAMLCEDLDALGLACGRCRACNLMAAGSHPDRIAVELEEKASQLKIDQIRHLGERLSLTSQRGSRQVVLIDPADSLNIASANALLKTLEEPRAGTVIVLVADAPWRLPATIRSRCQRLELRPPPTELAMHWLQSQGLTEADAGEALIAAQGRPLAAKSLLNDGALEQRRRLSKALEALRTGRTDAQTIASEFSAQDPSQLLRWLAELLAEQYRERVTPGAALTTDPSLTGLWAVYERCLRLREQLSSSLRSDLTLIELLHDWAAVQTQTMHT